MDQFFYNIADKHGCFFDWMQILTHRAAQKKKQTLILAGYKHATIDRLTWVIIQFIKDASEILLIYSLTINGNWTETKVND